MSRPGLKALLLSITLILPTFVQAQTAKATFAGGCFWCMEEAFEKLEGVNTVVSGYIGGHLANPTYYQVSQGGTGHTEAIEMLYDTDKINYSQLLEVFWRNIDPVDGGGQFCDRGSQYRSGIFYHNQEQQRLAEASKLALTQAAQLSAGIVTEITAASEFTTAEQYHQDYYQKNPVRYRFYKYSCGRQKRLDNLWDNS